MAAATSKTALVCVGSGSELPWPAVSAFLQSEGLEASVLTFCSPSGAATSTSNSSSTPVASAALCSASGDSQFNREAFSAAAKALAPGAKVYVFDAQRVSCSPRLENSMSF